MILLAWLRRGHGRARAERLQRETQGKYRDEVVGNRGRMHRVILPGSLGRWPAVEALQPSDAHRASGELHLHRE
jgi:hypothetical protein